MKASNVFDDSNVFSNSNVFNDVKSINVFNEVEPSNVFNEDNRFSNSNVFNDVKSINVFNNSNVFSSSNVFSGSNVFNKVEPNIKPSTESLDKRLTKEQLEEFRQMMLGDKVIIGCDEVIEMYEDEEGLLECLVYLWQQQSQKFRLNLPLPIREWFLSKFESTSSEKYRNLVFYKGMHFKKGSEINLMPIDASGSFITSTTTDYELAKKFAYGFNDWCLKDNQICCVYRITGDLVFDVQPYRDFGEEEFIIYNPKFELIEILS